MPYAVHAFAVQARLVGKHHSRQQRLAVEVLAYVLRPLVHTEIEAYSVTGAVPEIAQRAPQRHTGGGVDLAAGGPLREHGHRQAYHTLEHQGVVLHLQTGTRSKRHGAGDVRSAEDILSAGIHQIEAPARQLGRTHARSQIVRQGGIGAAGGYIPETVAAVARNLRPQRRKALRGLPLRHATVGRLPFEPVEELLHCHSVLEAGLPQRGDLHVVLHGLP